MSITAEDLRTIKTFADLIPRLEDELGWPLQGYEFEDLTFEYSAEEVGLKEEDAAKVKAIHQLRPLRHGQPWGIFFVEFERKRMPVVVLRRILSHLVIKKRASANRAQAAAWDLHDLLFISAFGDEASAQREMAFAHFHQDDGELPTLRVLGWDGGDTPLKLDHVAKTLARRLQWPDDPNDDDAWRTQWSGAFRHGQRHVINTADALAEQLAELARSIRDAAQTLIAYEADSGPLRQLHNAFRTALIHDLSESDFADTYAQTITYGLLTAAISRTEMSEGRYGTALVTDDVRLMVPITNPFLREMMQTFLQAGGQHGGINFDELGIQNVVELLRGDETDLPAILRDFGNRTQGEDPVIHFYEHFLSAYNKQLKVQRGVFYTPQPAVSYIVRSVHELLQSEFGLADGLADTATWGEMAQRLPDLKIPAGTDPASPFVMILDIATGTATFLVEVIDVIHRTMTAKWKAQGLGKGQLEAAWNDYVPRHLLPRLYGYELMMAPYAIAHMKIGLKLKETGYNLYSSDERVRVYLTNALEPADDDQKAFQGVLPALAHEAKAVNEVKRQVRFTVVIGNPPYAVTSANSGEWITDLVRKDYYPRDLIKEQNPKLLLDDYVKFIRFAQQVISQTGIGSIGIITNHGYLDAPTFRSMRFRLMQEYKTIYIVDLHGNTKRKEVSPDGSKDENIFDIQQGVSICLLVRTQSARNGSSTQIQHADFFGTRESKYQTLKMEKPIENWAWLPISPASVFYLFKPQNSDVESEYQNGYRMTDIFPLTSTGIKTHRDHFVLDFDQVSLQKRIADFRNAGISDAELRKSYRLPDTRDWKLDIRRRSFLEDRKWKNKFIRCHYRPFDFRYYYHHDDLVELARRDIMDNLLSGDNIGLATTRQTTTLGFDHVICSRFPIEMKTCSHDRGSNFFPLYLGETELIPNSQIGFFTGNDQIIGKRRCNLAPEFLESISEKIGLEFVSGAAGDLQTVFGPEDVFHYIYSILYDPTYRSRYIELLKIDFPRVPLTSSLDLFRSLTNLGEQLIALHLVEFVLTDEPDAPADWPRYPRLARFRGGDRTVAKFPSAAKAWADGTVAINGSSGFVGVPEAVWNFQIGGYQVCHKWLKDRKGRTLSDEDLLHYAKIVTALHETIRLMEEIDEVIDDHGGWPDAFVTE